jgi:hypothetical protein
VGVAFIINLCIDSFCNKVGSVGFSFSNSQTQLRRGGINKWVAVEVPSRLPSESRLRLLTVPYDILSPCLMHTLAETYLSKPHVASHQLLSALP